MHCSSPWSAVSTSQMPVASPLSGSTHGMQRSSSAHSFVSPRVRYWTFCETSGTQSERQRPPPPLALHCVSGEPPDAMTVSGTQAPAPLSQLSRWFTSELGSLFFGAQRALPPAAHAQAVSVLGIDRGRVHLLRARRRRPSARTSSCPACSSNRPPPRSPRLFLGSPQRCTRSRRGRRRRRGRSARLLSVQDRCQPRRKSLPTRKDPVSAAMRRESE